MKKEFLYNIILSKPEHYYIGICNMSGVDFVPYLNEDISEWLNDNMERFVDYQVTSNVNPYKKLPEVEIVSLEFSLEEHAMAFKLRWI